MSKSGLSGLYIAEQEVFHKVESSGESFMSIDIGYACNVTEIDHEAKLTREREVKATGTKASELWLRRHIDSNGLAYRYGLHSLNDLPRLGHSRSVAKYLA